MKLAVQILLVFSVFIKYIVAVFTIIFGLLFSIWATNTVISLYISDHNSKILNKYKFQETEQSIIYDKIERWRTTFDGGSQLLAISINTLDIRNYNYVTDVKIQTCFFTVEEMSREYIPRKVYDINYTNIWYFGIPLETKTVNCKV
jgi:prenyltransferase beta subunit